MAAAAVMPRRRSRLATRLADCEPREQDDHSGVEVLPQKRPARHKYTTPRRVRLLARAPEPGQLIERQPHVCRHQHLVQQGVSPRLRPEYYH